jgi:hypothetical protein
VTAAVPGTAAPAQDEQLACPLCDYSLRGLIDPRCPECGYAFDWADLRDPARRRHPYLFEHHPERNVRSFLRTLLGHLRPRKFWGGLLPSQPSNPRRLLLYALIVVIVALVPAAALVVRAGADEWTQMTNTRRRVQADMTGWQAPWYRPPTPNATTQQIIDLYGPAPTVGEVLLRVWYQPRFIGPVITHALLLAWPGLSLAALMIFQISLRRARLRQVHLARCAVYCGDVVLWASLILAAWLVNLHLWPLLSGKNATILFERYHLLALTISALAVLVFVYRLTVALGKYLQFDHPISTALATQFIVLLFTLVVLANLAAERMW